MRVGVPSEIKNHEYRVGLTPMAVRELTGRGHEVLVQRGAGAAVGLDDDLYEQAGAALADDAEAVFAQTEMIVKVKEPQEAEWRRLREDQVLFTYLHLAPDRTQTEGLMQAGVTAIAYETVTDARGGLPLLAPMSTVAGRMSVQAGAHCLEKAQGGEGVLLPGVPGVPPGKVTIIGGGVVGSNAARIALGLGAQVTILEKSVARMEALDAQFGARLVTAYSTADTVEQAVLEADLVIGALLIPGAAAPKVVTRGHIEAMKRGSVLVDVAIDQGGCAETSHATTHDEPTYIEGGVVHYCVANMPGAVARTSTLALNNATLPFILALADKGWRRACAEDAHLRAGLNVHQGAVTYRAVADSLNLRYAAPADILGLAA